MKGGKVFHVVRALRPQQWTKNAVVFAAFIFALGDREQHVGFYELGLTLLGAVFFCLLSSSIYILNDIRDVDLDRQHPTKRFRPIASGNLSIPFAIKQSFALSAIAFVGAGFLSLPFLGILLCYYVMQLCYAYWLKHIVFLDVLTIALGFVLRALSGGIVIDVQISPWLLLCTMLLAVFLGLSKRRHEKVVLQDLGHRSRPSLEHYTSRWLDWAIAFVALLTVLAYTLYTRSPQTLAKYGSSKLIFTVPLVILGILRYLQLVYTREKGDRPEKVLLTDWPLISILLCYGLVVGYLILDI